MASAQDIYNRIQQGRLITVSCIAQDDYLALRLRLAAHHAYASNGYPVKTVVLSCYEYHEERASYWLGAPPQIPSGKQYEVVCDNDAQQILGLIPAEHAQIPERDTTFSGLTSETPVPGIGAPAA